MTWKAIKVEDQRAEFVKLCLDGTLDMTEICRQFEISRPTGYKWLHRHREYGDAGLVDQSRARKTQSGKTCSKLMNTVLEVKTI